MKETKMYKYLKKALPNYRATRIENCIELGTPDTFWQSKQGNFWAELKKINKNNLTPDTIIKPDWRPGQIGWAKDHIKYGGVWRLFIAINDKLYYTSIPKEKYLFSELGII